MRIVAVVQARLGSTRLPRKVLLPLGNETVLGRLLRVLKTCKELDELVLAVPYNDLFLFDIEMTSSVSWVRGPEHDVLQRFVQAANHCHADAVVRATGDSPLLDPQAVDYLVHAYRGKPCDYMAYKPEVRGLQSVEILSRECLERLDEMPAKYPDREHAGVTYVLRYPDQFDVQWVRPAVFWTEQPSYRVCVDTAEDLEVVRAVVAALGEKANRADEVVLWLDHHPEVAAINRDVVQVS